MSATLAERIVQESLKGSNTKNTGRRSKNLALFLSQKDEIQEALNMGWSVMAVWRHLRKEGRFSGTYECFLNHTKRSLKIRKYVSPSSHRPAKETTLPQQGVEKNAQKRKVAGFEFKPIVNPKELYGEEE